MQPNVEEYTFNCKSCIHSRELETANKNIDELYDIIYKHLDTIDTLKGKIEKLETNLSTIKNIAERKVEYQLHLCCDSDEE